MLTRFGLNSIRTGMQNYQSNRVDICNYEYQTIKDFILWKPPVDLQLLWAQHLHYTLAMNSNGAPEGWLRKLICPIGTNIGKQLMTSEKELIHHLYTIPQLTPQ